MQLRGIVLYSKSGERRILPFEPGKVNIITGRSRTGKSAIAEVINYCLGSDDCTIYEGPIKDTVSWFGVLLTSKSGDIFVGREAPAAGARSSAKAFIAAQDRLDFPQTAPREPNASIEEVTRSLGIRLGIKPVEVRPPGESTRTAPQVTFRHALTFCFQQQAEIATNKTLFHNQGSRWEGWAVEDTLPYFLGAVGEQDLAVRQALTLVKKEASRLNEELQEVEALQGRGLTRGRGLMEDAKALGLIPTESSPQSFPELRSLLSEATRWTITATTFPGSEPLAQLQDELREVNKALASNSDARSSARLFQQVLGDFETEETEQRSRLLTIGLQRTSTTDGATCPVCQTRLSKGPPSVLQLEQSITRLGANLKRTSREKPRIDEYAKSLDDEREVLRQRHEEKRAAIQAILREHDKARQGTDVNIRRAEAVGKAKLWLESVSEGNKAGDLRAKLEDLSARAKLLDKELDPETKEEKLESISNILSRRMSELAAELKLEYSQFPVRLDWKRATVVVDTDARTVPLANIGSAENHLGYHLVAHSALHEFFIRKDRPVPRFLFLDQPSQVYFPREPDPMLKGSPSSLSVRDREALERVYAQLFSVVEGSDGKMQAIVTEHADLPGEQFQDAVVENWWDSGALVPRSWLGPST
jgi:hypothetical protein